MKISTSARGLISPQYLGCHDILILNAVTSISLTADLQRVRRPTTAHIIKALVRMNIKKIYHLATVLWITLEKEKNFCHVRGRAETEEILKKLIHIKVFVFSCLP